MDRDPDRVGPVTADRRTAARAEFDAQRRRFEQARAELQEVAERIHKAAPQWEALRQSAFERLHARLDSMPVVEQAKGVLMAQHHCGPDEAFDLLRRASQRANLRISVLAEQIVAQIASPPRIPSNVAADPNAIGGLRGQRPGFA